MSDVFSPRLEQLKNRRRITARAASFAAIALWCVAAHCYTIDAVYAQSVSRSVAQVSDTEVPETLSQADDAQLAADIEYLERKANVLRHVIKRVRPAVVHIEAETQTRIARYAHRTLEEAGSGVIIAHQGRYFVLTNRHVVRETPLDKIQIRLEDGSQLEPIALWSDAASDIALLEIAGTPPAVAKLGDSDRVEIGDFVLAVGSPFGLSHSVTFGIISAKGRRDLDLGENTLRLQDFLQTDAAINPGNSGGPLLNVRGEVIGINTAIASASGGSEGIGFAIPINMAMGIVEQLLQKGRVERAYMGVQLDSQFTSRKAQAIGLPRKQGALVNGVTPGSPAARAQIQPGDVILEFDGVSIEDDNHLVNRVALTPIGKEVAVTVWRQGQVLKLRLQVEERARYESEVP